MFNLNTFREFVDEDSDRSMFELDEIEWTSGSDNLSNRLLLNDSSSSRVLLNELLLESLVDDTVSRFCDWYDMSI